MRETQRVAVVGAGGFLGTTLLDRAAAHPSVDVVAVVRSPRSLPMVLGRCADIVITGGRKDSLVEALERVDGVIDVSVGPPAEIVESARTNASACENAGITRLVYTSSAAAQPLQRHMWRAAEPSTPYGRQKALAEQEIALCRKAGVAVTIVRPGLVWGPRSPWTIRHIDTLMRGAVIAPAGASSCSAPHLAFAPNLADALLNAATSQEPLDRTVDFADSWWQSWEDYARTLAAAMGVGDRVRVATRIRPGPWGALAVEAVSLHPPLKRLSSRVLERAPSFITGVLRARLKSPRPPAHVLPLDVPVPAAHTVRTRMSQTDIDVFVRWRPPRADGRELLEPVGTEQRDSAIADTLSWARDTGFLPPLERVDA